MFRLALSAARCIRPTAITWVKTARIIPNEAKQYSTLKKGNMPVHNSISLIQNKQILEISNNLSPFQARTVTKFSLKRGKRKTVKAVVRRFFRLHWGGWIRTKVGKNKKIWKRRANNKRRLKQHVFCNNTQNKLLDKMVTKMWKRPRYYVEDPYAPYHTREEFPFTRKKPVVRD